MKIFTAGFLTESCDLSPTPTNREAWFIHHPDNTAFRLDQRDLLTIFRDMANAKDWEVAESICAIAFPPGGRTVRTVYEDLRTMILNDLEKAMPVDGVLLQLHGAAMAYGYDDCEGDLLKHIRELVGPDVPIGAELDPHCHLTELMVENSTALVLYKTMTHIDREERAVDLFNIMADTLEGRVKPVMALFDCRIMNATGFDETCEPMKSFLESVYKRENEDKILSISPVHCYPAADIPQMGSKMLVITDNDPVLADKTAKELGWEFYLLGKQLPLVGTGIDESLDKAEEKARKGQKGIELIDLDDAGGFGFPTDGTDLLHAMFKRGMTNVAAGLIYDPLAVSTCHDAGEGTELMLRIGGKVSPISGVPIDLKVVVERIEKDAVTTSWRGSPIEYGDAAVVRSGDIELLLASRRVQDYDLRVFRELGVKVNDKQYLVFKCFNQPEETIFVFGEKYDYRNWDFTRISRPRWPWDENPFAQV